MQFDASTDVEWCGARVADQVRRRDDTEQAKREPLEVRIRGPAIVELADGREQLVGRERQAPDGVDLVDEHDYAAWIARQDNLPQRLSPALERPQPRTRPPEPLDVVFQLELLSHLDEEPSVPLLGGEVLPDGGQVEHRDPDTLFAQARCRPHHQRRLSHLPGREHIAEPPCCRAS